MHYKRRLLLILHFTGANLLMVLGLDFPTIDQILVDVQFNQSLNSPLNMTDCYFANESRIDVICHAPHWVHGVKKTQLPRETRYLKIQNTSLSHLEEQDFLGKTISA